MNKGNEEERRVVREPRGGEWLDCLSASEIDKVLGVATGAAASAMEFYNFRVGNTSKGRFQEILEGGVRRWGTFYVPLHLRHHWVLLRVSGQPGRLHGQVFDSAPSMIVKKDVLKWLKGLLLDLHFVPCMRQMRTSNECGIFVLANTIRLAKGLVVTTPPMPGMASLAHFRGLLAKGSFDEVIKRMTNDDFPFLTGGDWGSDLSSVDIDATFNALAIRASPANFTTLTGPAGQSLPELLHTRFITMVPVWTADHWIAGLHKGADIFFMDSAPQARYKAKMEEVALKARARGMMVNTPRQPAESHQCGLHLLVNSILFLFGVMLSAVQFPYLDLDALRGGIISAHQVFDFLFLAKLSSDTVLEMGDVFVAKEGGVWFTGTVGSKRRGMTTVDGWRVEPAPVSWSTVWSVRDTHQLLVLHRPAQTLLVTPAPAISSRRGIGRGRGEPNDIPLPASHQNIRRNAPGTSSRRVPQEEVFTGNLELLSTEVLAFLENAPTRSGFHFTAEGSFPPPHSYKVRDVMDCNVLEQRAIPHLSRAALAAGTVNGHRQCLEGFKLIEPDLLDLPLDIGLIEWYTRVAIRTPWQGSTLETKLATTAGALRLLPLYSPGRSPIIMGQSVLWTQAVRAAHKRALYQVKKKAVPAPWDVVEKLAMDFEGQAGLLIFLSYCCCSRVGDACRLRREDISITPAGVIVTFRRGKVTMKRGAYSVPMPLPADSPVTPKLLAHIQGARGFIFRKNVYKASQVILRTVGLTLHSLRRGAVKRLAESGMPPTEMIKFTGHATVESLISYLDDGVLDPNVINGLQQGQVLFGGGSGDQADFVPSTNEILMAFPSLSDKRAAPLHIKAVNQINIQELEKLPCQDPAMREFLGEALQWIRDPTKYSALIEEGMDLSESRTTPLNDAMMKALLEAKCELAKVKIVSEVFPFGVTELKVKDEQMYYRKRPIFEPTINRVIKTFPHIHLTSMADNIQGARAGEAFVQLDFVSFYDEIPLEDLVKMFFGVRWKGVYYTLMSLPMGLRVSVLVACAITWFLVNFPHEGVTINTFVDNVRFGGDPKLVVKAVLEFVRRCKEVGATLDNMPESEEEVMKLMESEGDFLGIRFSYKDRKMRLTAKTLEKVKMVEATRICREPFSFRQFAVIMGLFNFSARVLRFPAYKTYHLLRRYREEAAMEALFPSKIWGSRELMLTQKEQQDLHAMEDFFMRNEWTSYEEIPPVDVHIFSDACGKGWGGILRTSSGEIVTAAGTWSEDEMKSGIFEASAVSEPEGLIRVWKAFSHIEFKHAKVFLDHEPLVWGFQKGRPHSYHYNKALEHLSEGVKHASTAFCPGVMNPADFPSRGMEVPKDRLVEVDALIRKLDVEDEPLYPKFMT